MIYNIYFTIGIFLTKIVKKLEKVRKKVRNFYLEYQALKTFSNFPTFFYVFIY